MKKEFLTAEAERVRVLLFKEINKETSGPWFRIKQSDIRIFGKLTRNNQFIHSNRKMASLFSPYTTLIGHAYFTLSLIPHLTQPLLPRFVLERKKKVAILNYGFNRVRFPHPVVSSDYIRARRMIVNIQSRSRNTLVVVQRIIIEIKGKRKPAAVAESIILFWCSDKRALKNPA